jgi:hypothetical protein
MSTFHYAIFGSTEGDITAERFSALTLFGATFLRRPTLAQRIQDLRAGRIERPGLLRRLAGTDRGLILTLFGATEIRSPTVIEEYTALRNLVQSGSMTAAECRDLLNRVDLRDNYVAFTLFGACTSGRLARNKQLKALEASEKAGVLDGDERRTLTDLIDAPLATSADVLGRLIARPA